MQSFKTRRGKIGRFEIKFETRVKLQKPLGYVKEQLNKEKVI